MEAHSPQQAAIHPQDLETLSRLIRSRRSIFTEQLSNESLPREMLEVLFENAHWAPTHGRTEPWHFIVYSGDARARFGQAHADLYRSLTPEPAFKPETYEKLRERPLACGHLIALCLRRGGNPKIPLSEELAAAACAVQNLHLTATAMGLAGYWSTSGMTYREEMKPLLGLRPEDQVLGFFFLGKPRVEAWPEGRRKTRWEDHVQWIED
jgi:nitroreductase